MIFPEFEKLYPRASESWPRRGVVYWFFAWIAACVTSNLISRRVIVCIPGLVTLPHCDVSSSRSYRWRFARWWTAKSRLMAGVRLKNVSPDRMVVIDCARRNCPSSYLLQHRMPRFEYRVVHCTIITAILSREKWSWKSDQETNACVIDHEQYT